MAKFYPKKQTAWVFAVCLIAVIGTATYVKIQQMDSAEEKLPAAEPALSQNASESSYDWREDFLGQSSTTDYSTPTNLPPSQEKLTEVDRFGRTVFTKVMELEQAGLAGDEDAISNVTGKIIDDTMGQLPSPKEYARSDIKISGTADKTSATAYAIRVAEILRAYMPEKNEAELALEAYDNNDMSLLSKIDPLIANYKKAISELLATPAPAEASTYHLGLVNGISISLYSAEGIRVSDTDAIKGLNAISLETVALDRINNAIQGLKSYFSQFGIQFS